MYRTYSISTCRHYCAASATLSFALATAAIGCGGSGRGNGGMPDDSNLAVLASLYARFQAMHRGQFPTDETQFKEFIAREGADRIQRAGVENVDALFVSDRDNQPYVILYGKQANNQSSAVIGYEQQGREGKRYVGYRHGAVEEVDEARFRELIPSQRQ